MAEIELVEKFCMAFRKKSSRLITVELNQYRWSVSEDSGFSVFVVQSAAGNGQRLEVIVNWETNSSDNIQPPAITPSIVSYAISAAIREGFFRPA